MKKKNILYISKDGFLGGSAQSLLLLLEQIKEYHNISVLFCQKGPLIQKIKKLNIKTYYIPFQNWRQLKYLFKNIIAVYKLKKILHKESIEIIHSNSYEVNPLMVFTADKKIKTICHVRDMITNKKAKKFFLQKSKYIITISHAVKKQILKLSSNIKVIYNGVDIKRADKSKNNIKKLIPQKKPCFLTGVIGNCEPRKQQEDLIKAGLLLLSQYKNIQYLIIGNYKTEYGKRLKQMVPKNTTNFYFIDYVDDIYTIIKGLDIIINTAKEEAFGRTLIEAHACKKPVIGAKTGGVPEIIKHEKNGLLYPVGDYRKLATQIEYLYKNKRKQKTFGQNGYKQVKEKFTLQQYVNSILKLYK